MLDESRIRIRIRIRIRSSPDPYLRLMDPDQDPEGQITYGSRIRIRDTAQKNSLKYPYFTYCVTSLLADRYPTVYLKVKGSDVAQDPRDFSIDENPGPDLDPGAPLIQLHLLTQSG